MCGKLPLESPEYPNCTHTWLNMHWFSVCPRMSSRSHCKGAKIERYERNSGLQHADREMVEPEPIRKKLRLDVQTQEIDTYVAAINWSSTAYWLEPNLALLLYRQKIQSWHIQQLPNSSIAVSSELSMQSRRWFTADADNETNAIAFEDEAHEAPSLFARAPIRASPHTLVPKRPTTLIAERTEPDPDDFISPHKTR